MSRDQEDLWSAFKDRAEESAERRAMNRAGCAEQLKALGIPFTTNNAGVHLMLTHNGQRIDYWPGTGKWRVPATGHSRRGIKSLLDFLKVQQ